MRAMNAMSYAGIAFEVLYPFLGYEVPEGALRDSCRCVRGGQDSDEGGARHGQDTYHVAYRRSYYSFKDYAARFFGRMLNYFLGQAGARKVVIVATSGDTGGAVADAFTVSETWIISYFFPKGSISAGQRRQMTTLGDNVYAFEVTGISMSVRPSQRTCLATRPLRKRCSATGSVYFRKLHKHREAPAPGRLSFFRLFKVAAEGEEMIASVPSGNFGDMMGTVIAKQMGLPVSKIICGVNENTEFPEFLHGRVPRKTVNKITVVGHDRLPSQQSRAPCRLLRGPHA